MATAAARSTGAMSAVVAVACICAAAPLEAAGPDEHDVSLAGGAATSARDPVGGERDPA